MTSYRRVLHRYVVYVCLMLWSLYKEAKISESERDIYDVYADTFIDSALWLSKVRKTVFRDSQSKTKS